MGIHEGSNRKPMQSQQEARGNMCSESSRDQQACKWVSLSIDCSHAPAGSEHAAEPAAKKSVNSAEPCKRQVCRMHAHKAFLGIKVLMT